MAELGESQTLATGLAGEVRRGPVVVLALGKWQLDLVEAEGIKWAVSSTVEEVVDAFQLDNSEVFELRLRLSSELVWRWKGVTRSGGDAAGQSIMLRGQGREERIG